MFCLFWTWRLAKSELLVIWDTLMLRRRHCNVIWKQCLKLKASPSINHLISINLWHSILSADSPSKYCTDASLAIHPPYIIQRPTSPSSPLLNSWSMIVLLAEYVIHVDIFFLSRQPGGIHDKIFWRVLYPAHILSCLTIYNWLNIMISSISHLNYAHTQSNKDKTILLTRTCENTCSNSHHYVILYQANVASAQNLVRWKLSITPIAGKIVYSL